MAKKIYLDAERINEYRANEWVRYASSSHRGMRFEMNFDNLYRVTVEGEVIYEGSDLQSAVDAWNENR